MFSICWGMAQSRQQQQKEGVCVGIPYTQKWNPGGDEPASYVEGISNTLRRKLTSENQRLVQMIHFLLKFSSLFLGRNICEHFWGLEYQL